MDFLLDGVILTISHKTCYLLTIVCFCYIATWWVLTSGQVMLYRIVPLGVVSCYMLKQSAAHEADANSMPPGRQTVYGYLDLAGDEIRCAVLMVPGHRVSHFSLSDCGTEAWVSKPRSLLPADDHSSKRSDKPCASTVHKTGLCFTCTVEDESGKKSGRYSKAVRGSPTLWRFHVINSLSRISKSAYFHFASRDRQLEIPVIGSTF
jgi:hypothetical protein